MLVLFVQFLQNNFKSLTKNLCMKKTSLITAAKLPRILMIAFALASTSLVLFSFTVYKLNNDFLKELGISKTEADKKITHSILGGYLDAYGVKNAKNILLGNRASVAKDLLVYTKQYVNSSTFKTEYAALKERNKPEQYKVQTPEEMQQNMVTQYKKGVADMEGYIKKADANMKPMFEKSLVDAKKMLKEAEDPNNKNIANYRKNYPELVKTNQQGYDNQLKEWEANYPANHMLYVKKRLQQFMDETEGIDFTAELTVKNGKKVFVDRKYESKGSRWKMGYRAGKEVVETARSFVQGWIAEIN
jgi:hypothetical protein